MKAKMPAPTTTTRPSRDRSRPRRAVPVGLSRLAFDALAGDDGAEAAPGTLQSAVRCYLGDRGANQPACQCSCLNTSVLSVHPEHLE